jgi:hypothetical protein
MKDLQLSPFLIAGALAGEAGLITFLVIHHYWILPIWFILPLGVFIAGVGGVSVGWCYFEIRESLPPRPWTSLAMAIIVGLILVPSIVVAELRPPFVDFETGTILREEGTSLVIRFVVELILLTILAGLGAGWVVGRTSRAAVSTAVAGAIFALGPGHNIPFLANTPATGKGIMLLVAIILISSLVLVEGSAWISTKSQRS